MEDNQVVKLISQFLLEHDYKDTLKALETESGRVYCAETSDLKTGELQSILDDFAQRKFLEEENATSVEHLFNPGKNEYANKLWCSFDGLCEGVNLIVILLMDNGVLLFGGAKSQLGMANLPLPLKNEAPPIPPIPTMHSVGEAGVLCIDIHPKRRNILLCGNMDRSAYVVETDLETDKAKVLHQFSDHTKYVVQAQWSPSGKFLVTGSYDHSLCVYRTCSDEVNCEYELVEKIEVNGAVECLAFAKNSDEFVFGIRNDNLLHCYDLSSQKPVETRTINLNKFGDDFVSFVPMHLSFSPDGQFLLLSTDKDRLIMLEWEGGHQIANFYGATNDELSQPRHCWDSCGKYIYGTSQDFSICVWEIRSQKLVARLKGHTATVRNLHFCGELGVLLSCAFDGTIKLWKKLP